MTIQTVTLAETNDFKVFRLMFVPMGEIDLSDPEFYKELEKAFLTATTKAVGKKSFRIFSEHGNIVVSQVERIVIAGDSIALV